MNEAIRKLISVATAEIGYCEKASDSQLDSKTANTGQANYTKYWRDIDPGLQREPWCAGFVSWCFMQAFGLEEAKRLLRHWPYIYCPALANLFNLDSNPQVGDIILFYRNCEFAHTGIVVAVDNDNITTIEGNTYGADSIIANGYKVCLKQYNLSDIPRSKFAHIDYASISTDSTQKVLLSSFSAEQLAKFDILTEMPKLSTEQISKIIEIHFANSSVISTSDASGIHEAQEQTTMSALPILAIGALESGYGTSNIAVQKNNLWGYGAVNSNPLGGAHTYSQIAQGAAQYAQEVIKDYYNGYGAKSVYQMGSGDNPAGVGYAYYDDEKTIDQSWWKSVSSIMKTFCDTLKKSNLDEAYSGSYSSSYYDENATENAEESVVWNNRVKEYICKPLSEIKPMTAFTGQPTFVVNDKDATKFIGATSWSNSIDELATTFSFEIAKTDMAYIKDLIYVPKLGDIFRYAVDKELFNGLIISVNDGDINKNTYVAADIGWWLNKTKQTYQFRCSASEALQQICDDLHIPVDTLPELNTALKIIYFDKTISEIIKDILAQCGGGYNFDFSVKGLRIYKIGAIEVNPKFKLAVNGSTVNSIDYIGNKSHETSIDGMYNSLKITAHKDNVYREIALKQNTESIGKYGFLQEIVSIDEEKDDAQRILSEKYAEHSSIPETLSFEIIEDVSSYTRAGNSIKIAGKKYNIKSTSHSIKNSIHYNQIEVMA